MKANSELSKKFEVELQVRNNILQQCCFDPNPSQLV